MVHLREEKKQKKIFLNFLEENKKNFIKPQDKKNNLNQNNNNNSNKINFKNKNKFKIEYKEFQSFKIKDSFYETSVSKYFFEEEFLSLDKDSSLFFDGFKKIYIEISKDINLKLDFSSDKNSILFLKIKINKNIKLNLEDIEQNKNSFIFIEIFLDENSNLNHGKILNKAYFSHLDVYLSKNSKYNFICSYYLDNNNSYMKNSAHLLGELSCANLIINGGVIKNSSIINDGIINISKTAPNSSGHQKLTNLILDKTSKVISEPILEIGNNNVSCSHGCTIAQISEDIDFYCNTRGIEKQEAINLFLEGFNSLVYDLLKKDLSNL